MPAPEPTDEALQQVLQTIIARLMKLLTRKGILVEEEGQMYLAEINNESEQARALWPLQNAAATGLACMLQYAAEQLIGVG